MEMDLDKQTRRLGKRVLKVYQENDAAVWFRAVNQNTSCKQGCSACCHNIVLVTIPEAVVIADHLMTSGYWKDDKDIETFMAKVYKQIAVFEHPELEEHQYAKNGMPCVFLDQEKGTCTTYDQRPSACRYHFVTSDPVECQVDHAESSVNKINMEDFECEVVAAAKRVSDQVGTPHLMVPMAIGVSWALKALSEGYHILNRGTDPQYGVMNLGFWKKVHPLDEAPEISIGEETVEAQSG